MLRIRISDLKPGMVVGEDVYDNGSFPFINEGVPLTQEIINSLRGKDIHFIFIKVPEGYNSDEDVELFNPKGDLDYRGRVYIKETLRPSLKITSGRSIIINGLVKEGCALEAKSGNVSIKGSIEGSKEKPVSIVSHGNLLIQDAAVIKHLAVYAGGNVTIDYDLRECSDCSVTAKGDITVNCTVVSSRLHSGGRIKLMGCGDGERECIIEAFTSSGNSGAASSRRIMISRDVNPQTLIVIDNHRLEISKKAFSLVFYLEGQRVVSAPCTGC